MGDDAYIPIQKGEIKSIYGNGDLESFIDMCNKRAIDNLVIAIESAIKKKLKYLKALNTSSTDVVKKRRGFSKNAFLVDKDDDDPFTRSEQQMNIIKPNLGLVYLRERKK